MTSLAPAASAARRRGHRVPAGVLGLLGLLTLVAVLELVPRTGLVDERYLPPFSSMAASLADQLGTPAFWAALSATLRGWAIGLAIAMVAGVVLGLVIGSIPVVRAATNSTSDAPLIR